MIAFALTLLLLAPTPAAMPDVVLLMGQSNMSGRGAIADLRPAEMTPDPAILLLGNDGAQRVAREPLDAAAGQVDIVSADDRAGVGPGLFFARAWRRMTGHAVLLVPCAKGGSSIAQWRPAVSRETLYGSCLARALAAGRVAAVLWYQGESDAKDVTRASSWGEAFQQLTATLRRDLATPTLPIVAVSLADAPPEGYPGWTRVQQSQAAVRLDCVGVVAAGRLAVQPDRLHLTTDSQRRLGPRLARALARLRRRGCGARGL